MNIKGWIPKKTSCLCSEHFKEEFMDSSLTRTKLKADAVPSIFYSGTIQQHMTQVIPLEKKEIQTFINIPITSASTEELFGKPAMSNESNTDEVCKQTSKIPSTLTSKNIMHLKHKLTEATDIIDEQNRQIKILQQTVLRQSQQILELKNSTCDINRQNSSFSDFLEINIKAKETVFHALPINKVVCLSPNSEQKKNILNKNEKVDDSDDSHSNIEAETDYVAEISYTANGKHDEIQEKLVRSEDRKEDINVINNHNNKVIKKKRSQQLEQMRQCPFCEEKFFTINELKEHRTTHKGPYSCKQCDREFLTWRALVKHERAHVNDEKSKICEICSKEFKTSIKLTKHRYTHKVFTKILCAICGKVFTRKENLTRHMLIHQNIKRHKCEFCVEQFTRSDQLKMHLNVFHAKNSERQNCSICKYSTVQKMNLRAHMLAKHLVKVDKDMNIIGYKNPEQNGSYKCSVCDKVLGSYQALGTHTKIHTGLRKFLCKHCGKHFKSKLGLDVHERTHTGERPFPCTVCPKKFIQRTCLTTHMLTHTGQKPHQCKVCLKRFTQSQHLRAHVLIHTGERKHVCNICNKTFALRDGLRYHKMTHTGETPYVCQLCGRGFYIPYKLKVHMAKCHKIGPEINTVKQNQLHANDKL